MSNPKYEKLLAEKKKVRHWLHWVIIFLTLGVWFFPYLLIFAFTMIHNNHVSAKMEGLLLGQDSGVINFDSPQVPINATHVSQNIDGSFTIGGTVNKSRLFNEESITQVRADMEAIHGKAVIDSLSDSQIVSLNRIR